MLLQNSPIVPAILPTELPIDANLFLNPSTVKPAFSKAFLNHVPTLERNTFT